MYKNLFNMKDSSKKSRISDKETKRYWAVTTDFSRKIRLKDYNEACEIKKKGTVTIFVRDNYDPLHYDTFEKPVNVYEETVKSTFKRI